MHLGNARGGALGDCLAAAMDWAGYDVTREFLINDAGNQILKFGKSLAVRYLQIFRGEDAVPFPEDCTVSTCAPARSSGAQSRRASPACCPLPCTASTNVPAARPRHENCVLPARRASS